MFTTTAKQGKSAKRKSPPISIRKIIRAYKKKACNLSATAAALGVSRETLYDWQKEFPEQKSPFEDLMMAITHEEE